MRLRSKVRELITAILDNMHKWRKLVVVFSCFVVFAMTYLLIVPAFTLDKEEAAEQGGIDVGQKAVEETTEGERGADISGSESGFDKSAVRDKPDQQVETANAIQELKLAENDYKVVVSYGPDAEVPDGSHLDVREILESDKSDNGSAEYDEFVEKTQETLGMESSEFQYARFFDIKIVDGNGEKVTIAAPVDVKIDLDDRNFAKEDPANTQVVHFADGEETGEVIKTVDVDNDVVSFEAEGFSAYAIVKGPDPIPKEWSKVESLGDLAEHASDGIYIGHIDGYYFTSGITQISGSRTGITKTTPKQTSNPPEESAVPYYFETVSENQYKLYCVDEGKQKYIVQASNSLNLTENAGSATTFTVEEGEGEKVFRLKGNDGFYVNMQGGSNGKSFAAFNNADDVNAKLYLWYYTSPEEDDPFKLDGKTYGLMYWSGGVAGKAMMGTSANPGTLLDAKALTVMSTANKKNTLYVPDESDITMWTFHWQDDNLYYLTAVVDGSTKYLRIDENGPSMVSVPDDNCLIKVAPGAGAHSGQVYLSSGKSTITYSGKVEDGFNVSHEAGREWLNFVELKELTSDYFRTYSAEKVSVSDKKVTNGSQVIVYTRYWNDTTKQYEYYAISGDGTLVQVYESGDSIEWVSGQVNKLLWDFTEYYWEGTTDPNYYYELYNEYSEKYVAPQLPDAEGEPGQLISDSPIGINMNGRRDGQYHSTILAWDKTNYAFAGLMVDDDMNIVACPKSEAMDFFFAIVEDINVDDDVHTVPTVDHTQYGITMRIKNIDTRADMSNFLGDDSGGITTDTVPGLLSDTYDLEAEDSFPTNRNGESLSTLYAGSKEVNHLFIKSTYNETGYFEYDSTQNFASLNGNDFLVYRELGSYDSAGGRDTLKHGQFFPFNTLKPGCFCSVNAKNQYGLSGRLPQDDPRMNEQLYNIEHDGEKADTYFAIDLEASFTQTPDGLDAWGHDIIFEFTGDDDFWLYVDGQLVIDLGGIHSAIPGNVNFRTGDVNVNGTPTTLRTIFEKNYRTKHLGASDEEVNTYLNDIFNEGSSVFKDFTNHTMRIFYMERGAGASNLQMKFNLAAVKKGTVQLNKEVDGTDDPESLMSEFPYQIRYLLEGESEENYHLLTNALPDSPQNDDYVIYKDSVKPVKYEKGPVTIGNAEYRDVFFLKHGETADISFPDGAVSYSIVECGVNTAVYNKVTVNGKEVQGTTQEGSSPVRKDFGIDYATPDERAKVNYVNTVDENALKTLSINKKLFEADGTPLAYPADKTPFQFRLYMSSEFEPRPELVNMHVYYVKNNEGYYCKWNKSTKSFDALNSKDFSQLTPEEKKDARFETSIYGSIGNIPADFTVEIRNVLVGTNFRVQERISDLPDGYYFQKYIYNDEDSDKSADEGISDTVTTAADPNVVVNNLKGWGLRLNKEWSDDGYMSDRDPTYFGIFIQTEDADNNEVLNLVDGTLMQLQYKDDPQTLYWYFQRLQDGRDIMDYKIREVKITGEPEVDDDGFVTNVDELVAISDGDPLKISGKQKGETQPSVFDYTVSYTEGELSDEYNVRIDTVRNERTGIILKKSTWDIDTPLEGARFTLTDPEGDLIGTFTSGSDGFITEAFLRENIEYTLTEEHAPAGWYGMPMPLKLVFNGNTLTARGVNSIYYDIKNLNDESDPSIDYEYDTAHNIVLTIKDRPYVLNAVKIDADTGQPMKGVKFALHRQITVGGITTIDLNPMPGYEELVTDKNGVIPLIDNTLTAGTYEIREKSTLSGYNKLSAYIQFTISDTGKITLGNHAAGEATLNESMNDESGEVSYDLRIFNSKYNVSIWKTDEGHDAIKTGATFALYKAEDYNDSTEQPKEGKTPIFTGTTDNRGLLKLNPSDPKNKIGVGQYRLVETSAPAGYDGLESAIKITVAATGVTAMQGTGMSEVATDKEDNPYHEYWIEGQDPGTYQIRVWNNPGVVLPNTGGIGTTIFYILGSILVLGGGIYFASRRRMK